MGCTTDPDLLSIHVENLNYRLTCGTEEAGALVVCKHFTRLSKKQGMVDLTCYAGAQWDHASPWEQLLGLCKAAGMAEGHDPCGWLVPHGAEGVQLGVWEGGQGQPHSGGKLDEKRTSCHWWL